MNTINQIINSILNQHKVRSPKLDQVIGIEIEYLRFFFDHVPAAIAIFDERMRYIFTSRGWLEDYKLKDTELIGRSHYEVFPEIPDRWKEIHRRCLAGTVEKCDEDLFIRKDGSKQWLHWEVHPWYLEPGVVGGLVMFTQDITPRKRMEEELATEITNLKKKEEELEAAIQEKDVLLKEVNHRVKNNLQMVASLFDLQIDTAEDEKVRKVLERNQERIQAIALVHEMLYNSQELATLDFSAYMKNLIKVLFRAYCSDPQKIILDCQVQDVELNLSYAVPLGLIVNEVMSNSLRYAFPSGSNGVLLIHFHPMNPQRYELIIKDNGRGLPEAFDFRKVKSLGMQIVCALADHLQSEMTLTNQNGTEFRMRFNGVSENKGG